MTCPNCGAQLPDNAAFCSVCGHHMTLVAPSPPTSSFAHSQNSPNFEQTYNRTASAVKNFAWGDYFSFRRMITPQLIQIIYITGVIVMTISSFVLMAKAQYGYGYGSGSGLFPGGFFGGLIFLIFGNLAWRLWCEFIIVIFRINSSLSNIDDNTRLKR